jgi:NitT/TauT family transport system substrate-binding protein
MRHSYAARWIAGAVLFTALLGVLRYKPWKRGSGRDVQARQQLKVGFLPVTCHLTCPVTDFATRTSRTTQFVSQRFNDFPTVVETMKAGRLEASFMIAPLAMKLREQGLPVKILYLGHRDGSEVMVRRDLPATSLRDLRGKVFAIPSIYSNQNLVIHKLMEDQGVKSSEIRFVEMPPPDMP